MSISFAEVENRVHFFAGNPLDRLSPRRKDDKWLAQIIAEPATCFLALSGSKVLFEEREGKTFLCNLKHGEVFDFLTAGVTHIFLGNDDKGVSYFALDLSSLGTRDPKDLLELEKKLESSSGPIRAFKSIRPAAFQLVHSFEAAIVAQARSILDWNKSSQYCSVCGSKTKSAEAGYKRDCPTPECASNKGTHNTSYPRTDPVMIAVILSQDHKRCLLGRTKNFPPGVYSCLSGFVEPGESIEESVRREVFEESGIRVGKVSYHSSQPWPFPSQLMIGCMGEAISEDIHINLEEMEDVKWFTKEEVQAGRNTAFEEPHTGGLRLPPKISISGQLLAAWSDL